MKVIIPCAGKGIRMGGIIPKTLIEINGKTLVRRVMDAWPESDYIIIANNDNLSALVKTCPEAKFAVQPESKGLAHAIACIEPFIQPSENFVVALGDCLYEGEFDVCMFEIGIGVCSAVSPEINKNYGVRLNPSGHVLKLDEKPKDIYIHPVNCGMGVYFLDSRVFSYLHRYPQEEFTDILQAMVVNGEPLKAVKFKGKYINVTTPEDVTKAEQMFP